MPHGPVLLPCQSGELRAGPRREGSSLVLSPPPQTPSAHGAPPPSSGPHRARLPARPLGPSEKGWRSCSRSVCPPSQTTHLGHLVAVEVQREAGTVVVQVAGVRQAQGAGQQGLLGATLPPGCTRRLQALAWGLLSAPLSRWALGAQGVGPASQQARPAPTPHLGQARTRDRRGRTQTKTHGHTRAPCRRERHGRGQQGPERPAPPRPPRMHSE